MSVLLLLAVSCSGNLDFFGGGGNDPFPGGGDDPSNQNNSSAPAETSPSYSGIKPDDGSSSDDNVANTTFDGEIKVVFNGSAAAVTGSVDGVSADVNGADVVLTNDGDKTVRYILSGTSDDGSFKLYSSKKQAIVLKDLTLHSGIGAALNNQSKKRTFVVLEGSSTLSDCETGSSGDYPSETSDEDMKAAFFSEGQLIFSGGGTLTVSAVGKAGITSDDYVRFMTGPTLKVSSSKGHGIRGKDAIILSGGTVEVTVESGATGKKCFTTDSLVYVTGGAATLTNKASAGTVDSETTGAACIKADKNFVIQGGTLTLAASGKGCKCISGDATGYFEGGTVTAKATGSNYGSGSSNRPGSSSDDSTSSKAVKFDGNLEFSGADVIASSSSHEAIESKGTIYISGGTVCASSSDDAINSSSTLTISDGIVYAYSTGNDGLDANGNLIIKGGTAYAIGCGSPEVAIDANTEQRYKFYLQAGNVIALGGIESGSSVSQAMISSSWNRSTVYTLCDGDKALFTFKTPLSGGSGMYMSAPSLVSGTKYSLITGAAVSGAKTYFDGVLSIGGTASGGTSSTVSASTYSSGGGNSGFGGR